MALDSLKKTVNQQIEVLWAHETGSEEFDLQFIRDHALAIVHLSDLCIRESGKPESGFWWD